VCEQSTRNVAELSFYNERSSHFLIYNYIEQYYHIICSVRVQADERSSHFLMSEALILSYRIYNKQYNYIIYSVCAGGGLGMKRSSHFIMSEALIL
jgi:hypothetical protein